MVVQQLHLSWLEMHICMIQCASKPTWNKCIYFDTEMEITAKIIGLVESMMNIVTNMPIDSYCILLYANIFWLCYFLSWCNDRFFTLFPLRHDINMKFIMVQWWSYKEFLLQICYNPSTHFQLTENFWPTGDSYNPDIVQFYLIIAMLMVIINGKFMKSLIYFFFHWHICT